MLNFTDFFDVCSGQWIIERTYHSVLTGDVERSHTEYLVNAIAPAQKQQMIALAVNAGIKIEAHAAPDNALPGFAIAFDTRSETGETLSMQLQALFVPDAYVSENHAESSNMPPPVAAQLPTPSNDQLIAGFYLRNEGYSEVGVAVGRFTYQPTRQTLEMTTYYRNSVAVDQMRMVAPDLRLRTIITYQRPAAGEVPTVIDLAGFGVERRQSA